MTKQSRLLIDIGNTQIKLGIWGEGKLKKCLKCNHKNIRPTINKYKSMTFEKLVYVSVVSDDLENRITNYLKKIFSLKPNRIKSTSSLLRVKNGYKYPSKLGDDRWCSIVGSYNLFKKPLILIDCGTAISIDCIDGKARHNGGYILSGFDGYRNSFDQAHNLKNMRDYKIKKSSRICLARETSHAVINGYILMVNTVVERIYKEFSRKIDASPLIIVTGSYGQEVLSHSSLKTNYEPDLVLKSIGLISDNT